MLLLYLSSWSIQSNVISKVLQNAPRYSAILSTFIKLPFVIKIFVLSIFEWRFTQVLLYFIKLQTVIKIFVLSILSGRFTQVLLCFIKPPFVIKIFVLSIFEWPLYTGFNVLSFPNRVNYRLMQVKSISAVLLSFIKLPFVNKIFVLSIFEWSFYTGFNVLKFPNRANYRLMQVKNIAECSKGSILQYFRPSLSYHLSLRSLFYIHLSGRFTYVLLYFIKPPFVIKIFVLSIFEWSFYTGFTVLSIPNSLDQRCLMSLIIIVL